MEYNENELYIEPDKQFIYVYKGHLNICSGYLYFHTDSYIKTQAKESLYLDKTEHKFIHQLSKIKFNKLSLHDDNKHIKIEY